jgi:fused signal recognition particle receptor
VSEEESREAREAWAELFGLEVPPPDETPTKRRGLFSRLKENLSTPRQAISPQIAGIFEGKLVDEESWEDLEDALMMADCGVEATTALVDRLRDESEQGKIVGATQLAERFTELVSQEMAPEPARISLQERPTVIMMVGVNGSGKTTTVGKLSHRLSALGLEVVVGAADTFRAAAIDQLAVWTDRAGVQLVRQGPGADPGAVAYDAVVAAKSRGADVVIVDTAGRLQTQKNLMRELQKVSGVLNKALAGAPHHVLLTLDATTGQNGLSQARLFGEAVDVDGVVLTKLDGAARGGIAVAIRRELGMPVKMVGSGETLEDLQPFDGGAFAEAIFGAD